MFFALEIPAAWIWHSYGHNLVFCFASSLTTGKFPKSTVLLITRKFGFLFVTNVFLFVVPNKNFRQL